jgi:hypothetical protein
MLLENNGQLLIPSIPAILAGSYVPIERDPPGTLSIFLEDQTTFDQVEAKFRLDPWQPEGYQVFDAASCGAIIVCGSSFLVLNAIDLVVGSRIELDDEEGVTINCLLCVNQSDKHVTILATDQRVCCLTTGGVLKWMWRCRTTLQPNRYTCELLRTTTDTVQVALVNILRNPTILSLGIDDGSELSEHDS